MLIDSHTHLDGFHRRGELEAVLGRAAEAGVGGMIAIGTGDDDWGLYRELALRHPGVIWYSVGLHPCGVEDGWEGSVAQIAGFWQGAAAGGPVRVPVALGECGLDRYHLPKDDPVAAERVFVRQRAAFAAQLAIAKALGCPVVVHSRGAFAECVEMIDASGVDWRKVVFHCFSDGAAEMGEINRRGGRGSFTGILTYKNAEAVRQAAAAQGIDRLMVETDAPYLAPVPHRGKPCEPAFVRYTFDAAAGLLGVEPASLEQRVTNNTKVFFGLG